MSAEKQSLLCRLNVKRRITAEITRLDFEWAGTPPRAGQFFLVKPERSSVFLGRPLSAALFDGKAVSFLAAVRGKGTAELSSMGAGETALLTGPLGNCWPDFAPEAGGKPAALVSGGIGIAPVAALRSELAGRNMRNFDFFAGFRREADGEALLSALGIGPGEAVIVSEEASLTAGARRGLVTGFFEARNYAAVFACGPLPMLKSAAALCREAGAPCFVSVERRMACGTGACLGCTLPTLSGGKRCCSDGPVFNAGEIFF